MLTIPDDVQLVKNSLLFITTSADNDDDGGGKVNWRQWMHDNDDVVTVFVMKAEVRLERGSGGVKQRTSSVAVSTSSSSSSCNVIAVYSQQLTM